MKQSSSNILFITFIITAIWDIILRILTEHFYQLPSFLQFDFIYYLIPYFKYHTLLSAALIAGFVGYITQYIIISLQPFPTFIHKNININNIISFLFISFFISGLIGFPIKISKLFPHLTNTYYKGLGTVNGFIADGVSGIIVQITLFILTYIYIYFNKA